MNLFKSKSMRNVIRSTVVAATVCAFASCSTNPVTGKKQVVLMSEQQELGMGAEGDPAIIQQFGLYPDSALQRYMNQRGQEMVRVSHRSNIPYHFRVLDSDVINAFATPGYVYFTRGIMAHINDEAQFSGVLGHEIGHITARHTVAQQTKQTFGQLGLIGAMIASPTVANMGQQAMQGMQLLFLKFDRNAESQADELGVDYSSKVGYDAHEMAKFFNTLKRQGERAGQELPEFLSTHPDPGNRYNRVNQLATEWQKANGKTNMAINRNQYLKLIEGIVYGEDPRQGFKENNMFYHPELRFQFATPAGWQYQNSPMQVAFGEPNGQAAFFLMPGQGNSPQEAVQAMMQQAGVQALESNSTNVNGFPAFYVVGNQVQQNQQTGQQQVSARVVIYGIQHRNSVYLFAGAAAPQAFNNYSNVFMNSIRSFRDLTDANIINIKPERVRLRTLASDMTFAQAMATYKMPQARYEELAILNGVNQTDRLAKGTIIKIVERN